MMKTAVCLGTAFLMAVPVAAPIHGADSMAGLPPPESAHLDLQFGIATWYGGNFQGLQTANGEKFDMNVSTAAHRHLPMGSLVRVTNLHNQKAVMVRINDRGPWGTSSIIDLSRSAAYHLGMQEQGHARVSLQTVALPQ